MSVVQISRKPPALLAPIGHALTPRARAQRVTFLLIATALMALGDLAMTLTYVTTVGMVESNPLARAVMEHGSPALVVVWKLATLVLGLGILFWKRREKAAEVGAWICFIAMTALSIYWLGFNHSAAALSHDYAALSVTQDPRWVTMSP